MGEPFVSISWLGSWIFWVTVLPLHAAWMIIKNNRIGMKILFFNPDILSKIVTRGCEMFENKAKKEKWLSLFWNTGRIISLATAQWSKFVVWLAPLLVLIIFYPLRIPWYSRKHCNQITKEIFKLQERIEKTVFKKRRCRIVSILPRSLSDLSDRSEGK